MFLWRKARKKKRCLFGDGQVPNSCVGSPPKWLGQTASVGMQEREAWQLPTHSM